MNATLLPRTPLRTPPFVRRALAALLVALLVAVATSFGAAFAQGADWRAIELTDARSGETFTIADFEGRTVLVETMATWCSNCRRQLRNVAVVRSELGDADDVVFVALSVEGNLPPERLAAYADREGFDWTFAVAPPAMLAALADAFGRTVLAPPATPHVIVAPDGTVGEMTTGITGPEELLARLR